MSHDASLKVRLLDVAAEEAGQRLDNYLLRHASGVPKTRVYRAIRKGEVRVNPKIKVFHRAILFLVIRNL